MIQSAPARKPDRRPPTFGYVEFTRDEAGKLSVVIAAYRGTVDLLVVDAYTPGTEANEEWSMTVNVEAVTAEVIPIDIPNSWIDSGMTLTASGAGDAPPEPPLFTVGSRGRLWNSESPSASQIVALEPNEVLVAHWSDDGSGKYRVDSWSTTAVDDFFKDRCEYELR